MIQGNSLVLEMLFLIAEDDTYIGRMCFLLMKHFMCVEQSTVIFIVYGEVKIMMMIMNMIVIH
jgi:hypothetical protein